MKSASCKRLSRAGYLERSIRFYSGIRDFRIFLDRNDIGWGQKWARRIGDSLDDALLLFPIVTPSYFSSAPCREEVLAFRARQIKLHRDDLILPVYYLTSELMEEGDDSEFKPDERAVGKLLREHQREDWRALRVTEETDPSYSRAIERLAFQATTALKRGIPAQVESLGSPKGPSKSSNSTATSPSTDDNASSAGDPVEATPKAASSPPGHIVSLTVNQMPGRADFVTISDAIARAPGGARIIVSPGHYRESLIINKPLELIGSGSREDIVIEPQAGEALIFDTNIGLVRNLAFRQSQPNTNDSCVWIKQGRLELEDCDVSGGSFACVAIINNADPRIRRNKIHNGQSAVYIKNARGTFEDNEIFGTGLSSIAVKEGADPIVRRNRIYDGKQSGIFIYEEGRGTFEDNEIFGHAYSGIAVQEGADPIVRRNRVHDCKGAGIVVLKAARGAFEDNEIFGNGSGISAADEADPVVRRNRIYDSKGAGIVVRKAARGTFEENEIFGNYLSGIEVKEDATPIVRRNHIHDGKGTGVFVLNKGGGTFESNEIVGNARAGINIREGCAPIVRQNRINWNGYEAVWIQKDGAGTFTDNDLTDNTRGAWDIDSASLPKVTREGNRE